MAVTDMDLNDFQVVLNAVSSDLPGFTHDKVQVTYSATLQCGSILDSAGTELAIASVADAYYVVDDITLRNLADNLTVGDTLEVACAHRGCVFNEDVITFSDAAISAAGKTALEAYMNKFATVEVED